MKNDVVWVGYCQKNSLSMETWLKINKSEIPAIGFSSRAPLAYFSDLTTNQIEKLTERGFFLRKKLPKENLGLYFNLV